MAQHLKEMNGLHEIKKLLHNKRNLVTRLKSQSTEWEKIFASCTIDRELVTRIYRELKRLNFPKIDDPMKKWADDMNRAFSKGEIKWLKNNHMKKC
jgi:hypothetical protein